MGSQLFPSCSLGLYSQRQKKKKKKKSTGIPHREGNEFLKPAEHGQDKGCMLPRPEKPGPHEPAKPRTSSFLSQCAGPSVTYIKSSQPCQAICRLLSTVLLRCGQCPLWGQGWVTNASTVSTMCSPPRGITSFHAHPP